MNVEKKQIVCLNNFCEHSHKMKGGNKKIKESFMQTVNCEISTYDSIVLYKDTFSFKE